MIDPLIPLEVNISTITRTSITATLDVTNFSNDFGVIENYAVWIREIENINEELPHKPGKTAISWRKVLNLTTRLLDREYRVNLRKRISNGSLYGKILNDKNSLKELSFIYSYVYVYTLKPIQVCQIGLEYSLN